MPLGREVQLDLSGGEQANVAPHLIDPRAFFRGVNLLLNDDGSAYKRGGSEKASAAAFGTALRAGWDGYLRPGRRTLVASSSAFGALEGEAIKSLGGSGFSGAPKVMVGYRDMVFIGGGSIYAGSRKTADYSTGTVKVVKGSKVVTGSGTSWTANVDVGMIFRRGEGTRVYVVAAVKSNTELELNESYEGANEEGKTYTLKRIETAGLLYKSADHYAVAGDRLLSASGAILSIAEPQKPHLWEATIPPQNTVVKNEHELGEAVTILGLQTIGVDKALVFHTGGIQAVSNPSYGIVDAQGNSQHPITWYSRDIVLWANVGVSAWRGALVVPALDGVYLIDGVSNPVPLSDSIEPNYRAHVQAGNTPGQAWTDRDHYFLPILDSGGVPVETLVCRLDRPLKSRNQVFYPWSRLRGAGGAVGGGVLHPAAGAGEKPITYGFAADGYLLKVNSYFDPDESNAYEHDGSVALLQLTTRDFSAGDLGLARFRRLELMYELEAIEGVDSEVVAEYGLGVRIFGLPEWDEVAWNEFEWAFEEETEFVLLEGGAPPNAGADSALAQNLWTWATKPYARYVRYRLSCADPVAKLTLRGFVIFIAQPEGVRKTKVA